MPHFQCREKVVEAGVFGAGLLSKVARLHRHALAGLAPPSITLIVAPTSVFFQNWEAPLSATLFCSDFQTLFHSRLVLKASHAAICLCSSGH